MHIALRYICGTHSATHALVENGIVHLVTPALVTALEHMTVVSYADASAAALLVFDYCLTFNLEVKHIWFSRWTIIKSIYVVMRYLPLLNMVGIMLVDSHRCEPNTCLLLTKLYCFFLETVFIFGELILTLRIWAIYARSVKIGIAMLLLFLGTVAISYANMHIFLKSLEYGHLDLPAGEMCVVVSGSRRIVINWIVLAIYDAVMATLLGLQAAQAFKYGGRSRLLWTIYKDGIIYYIYLMAISILAVAMTLILPPGFLRFLAGISHVIHSSLTARVILHAREQAEKQNSSACFTQMY